MPYNLRKRDCRGNVVKIEPADEDDVKSEGEYEYDYEIKTEPLDFNRGKRIINTRTIIYPLKIRCYYYYYIVIL